MGAPLFGTAAYKALQASQEKRKQQKKLPKAAEGEEEKELPASSSSSSPRPSSDSSSSSNSSSSRAATTAGAEPVASEPTTILQAQAQRLSRHATPQLRSRLQFLARAHADMIGRPVTELQVYETLYPNLVAPEGISNTPAPARETPRSRPSPGSTSPVRTTESNLTPRPTAETLADVDAPPSASATTTATTTTAAAAAPSSSSSSTGPSSSSSSTAAAAASSSSTSFSEGRRAFTGSITANGAGANTGAGVTRPKTEAEMEADRRYEEQIEEEYARREGGA